MNDIAKKEGLKLVLDMLAKLTVCKANKFQKKQSPPKQRQLQTLDNKIKNFHKIIQNAIKI